MNQSASAGNNAIHKCNVAGPPAFWGCTYRGGGPSLADAASSTDKRCLPAGGQLRHPRDNNVLVSLKPLLMMQQYEGNGFSI